MFRFEHPEFFWMALLTIALVLGYFIKKSMSQKDWISWGSEASNQKTRSSLQMNPRWLGFGLLASLLLVIAMVNPQRGYRTVTAETKSADLYILLDISNSMLAEDIAPNRLERAIRFALDLSTAFRSDKLGLILFAGNAYIQSPLTTDWHAIQLYLNSANPDQAGTQGTAIGEAIQLALKQVEPEEKTGTGALIVITDGEDHDSDATAAVEDASIAGWLTYVIGVGTETGSTIPVTIDGRKDVKRDESGQPVMTAMNRSLMMELAQKGSGKYFDLAGGDNIIEDLGKELANLERSRLEKRTFSEHKSYFQWFLLPSIILIIFVTAVNYKYDVI